MYKNMYNPQSITRFLLLSSIAIILAEIHCGNKLKHKVRSKED
jgi:hypothetical protein